MLLVGHSPKSRRQVGLAVAAAAVVIGASACGLLIDADAYEAPEIHQCNNPSFARAECASCTRAACSEKMTACAADAECCEAFDCLASCPPDAPDCRYACLDGPEAMAEPLRTLEMCRRSACAEECMGAGGYYLSFGEACNECAMRDCHAAALGCAGDVGCEPALFCGALCKDPDCRHECAETAYSQIPACEYRKPAAVEAFSACVHRGCTAECHWGTNWSCVGEFRWQGAQTELLEAAVYLRTFFGNQAVAGATVSVCGGSDPDCVSPTGSAETDAEGYACVDLTGSGAYGFTGYLEISGGDLATTLSYKGFPITRSYGVSWEYQVVTTGQAEGAARLAGTELDWSRGSVVVAVTDCDGQSAPGIRAGISGGDGNEVLAYFTADGVPSTKPTETDTTGGFLYINMPPSEEPVLVTATSVSDNTLVACRRVLVRPGKLTWVVLSPAAAGVNCE